MGTAIVITSGKGGTGKTALTCGVGAALARQGRRVLCLDLDVGLRNLDLVLGMTDRTALDFTDVIWRGYSLERAAVPHPEVENLHLLTAPMRWERTPDPEEMGSLLEEIRAHYDYCLIDSPAGIGPEFHLAACRADRAVVVVTTDEASIRDAQQVRDQLHRYRIPNLLVVNRLSRWMLRRQELTVDDIIDAVGLRLLGIVPEDRKVALYAAQGRLTGLPPRLSPMRAWDNIARRLDGKRTTILWH